jgi:hypothetical protein
MTRRSLRISRPISLDVLMRPRDFSIGSFRYGVVMRRGGKKPAGWPVPPPTWVGRIGRKWFGTEAAARLK